MKKINITIVGLFLLFSWVSQVVAQDACAPTPAENYTKYLDTGNLNCIQQYVEKEKKRYQFFSERYAKNIVENRVDRVDRTSKAWTELIKELQKTGGQQSGALRRIYDQVEERANSGLTYLEDPSNVPGSDAASALKNSWVFERGLVSGRLPPLSVLGPDSVILVQEHTDEACVAEGADPDDDDMQKYAACPKTSTMAWQLARSIEVGKAIATYFGYQIVEDISTLAALVDKEWNTFLFDSKPMLPFDVIATDLVARWSDGYETQNQGFRKPPEYQFFFLHPAPAFQYVGNAKDGQEFKPSVYVELIGINDWKGFNIFGEKFPWGVSLIMEYSDRQGVDDLGYGVLITAMNKLSVGLTNHGGDFGISLGFDLANFYQNNLKSRIDKLR